MISLIFQATTKNIKTMLGVRNFAGIIIAMKTPMLLISKKYQELFTTGFNRGLSSVKPPFVTITVNTKSSEIRSINIARIRKSAE